jgi:hypothetical protein
LRWCPAEWFDWHDLAVIIRHSDVTSNIYRALHPREAGWTRDSMLLATIADVARWLQWSKTKDGAKGRGMPEPIPRPGVQSRKQPVHPRGKGAPISKVKELLGHREPLSREERLKRLTAVFAERR